MIPYPPEPVFWLGTLRIPAYSIAAVAAVLSSLWMVLARARRKNIGMEPMFQLWFWMYLGAMLGAHLYQVLVTDSARFLADPTRIFRIDAGINSAGAISGGLWPGLLWCRLRGFSWEETVRRLDIIAYATPVPWMLGRLGCALAHDHLGLPSTSWTAVRFPEGPRFDLGLIEFFFLIGLVLLFWLLDRRARPAGFFCVLFSLADGSFRMWLGTLRGKPDFLYGAGGLLLGLACWIAMLLLQRSQTRRAESPQAAA